MQECREPLGDSLQTTSYLSSYLLQQPHLVLIAGLRPPLPAAERRPNDLDENLLAPSGQLAVSEPFEMLVLKPG